MLSYANAKHFLLLKKKVAAKLISRGLYCNVVTVRLLIVLLWVNYKICRKTDFINLLMYVLCFSARMFGTDARLLRKVEVLQIGRAHV